MPVVISPFYYDECQSVLYRECLTINDPPIVSPLGRLGPFCELSITMVGMNNRTMMITTALTCLLGALATQTLSDAAELKGLQLKPNGANGVSVQLDVDAPTAYKMTRSANGSTELILPDTQLPEAFQKTGLPGITDSTSGINATVTQRSGDVRIQLTPASTKTQQKSIQVTLSGAKPTASKVLDPGALPEEKLSTSERPARPKNKAAIALGDKPSADRPMVEQLFRQLQATVKPLAKPVNAAKALVIPAATPAKTTKSAVTKSKPRTPRLNPFKPLIAVQPKTPPVKTAQTVPAASSAAVTPVRGWGAGSSAPPSKLYTIPSVASSTPAAPVADREAMGKTESTVNSATAGLDAASQNHELLNTPDVSDLLSEEELMEDTPKTIKGYPPIEPEGLPRNEFKKAPEIKDWPWLSWMTSAGIMIMDLSMLGLALLIFRIRRSAPVRPIGLGYNDPRRLSHYEMEVAAEAHRASRYAGDYEPEPLPQRAIEYQERRAMRQPQQRADMYGAEYRERSFEPDMPERPRQRQMPSAPQRPSGVYPHRYQAMMPEPMNQGYYDESPVPSAYDAYEPVEPMTPPRPVPQPPVQRKRQAPVPPQSKPQPMLYRDELYPDLDLPSERRSQPIQSLDEPDMDVVVEQVIADWQASQGPVPVAKAPKVPAKKPFGLGINLFKKQQQVNNFMSHPEIDAPLISSSRKQAAYGNIEPRSRSKAMKPQSFQVDDEALDQLYKQDVGFEPDWIPERPTKTKTRLDKPKAIQRRSLLETSVIRQAAEQDSYFDEIDPAPIRPSHSSYGQVPPQTQQRRAIRYSPRR
jgi:hypothetical protein